MTVDQVKQEVALLNLANIRDLGASRTLTEDFYTMWSKFGPEAARTLMIPAVWNGNCPLPSEVL